MGRTRPQVGREETESAGMLEILIFATLARGRLFFWASLLAVDLADMMITYLSLFSALASFHVLVFFSSSSPFFFLFFPFLLLISPPFPYFLLSFFPFVFLCCPSSHFVARRDGPDRMRNEFWIVCHFLFSFFLLTARASGRVRVVGLAGWLGHGGE